MVLGLVFYETCAWRVSGLPWRVSGHASAHGEHSLEEQSPDLLGQYIDGAKLPKHRDSSFRSASADARALRVCARNLFAK